MYRSIWQNILIENGVDPLIATTLIGFTLWKKNEGLASLGKKLGAIIPRSDESPIIKDVIASNSNNIGLLILNKPISDSDANVIYNIIITHYDSSAFYDRVAN